MFKTSTSDVLRAKFERSQLDAVRIANVRFAKELSKAHDSLPAIHFLYKGISIIDHLVIDGVAHDPSCYICNQTSNETRVVPVEQIMVKIKDCNDSFELSYLIDHLDSEGPDNPTVKTCPVCKTTLFSTNNPGISIKHLASLAHVRHYLKMDERYKEAIKACSRQGGHFPDHSTEKNELKDLLLQLDAITNALARLTDAGAYGSGVD